MKIVQALGWYFPDSLGGTEIYVSGLSRRLQDSGHQVVVAAPDVNISESRTYRHEGISVYRYPVPANPTRVECQELSPASGTELFNSWVAEQRPDIVHFHTFVTGLGLHEVRAAKATGARVVVTTHSSSLGYICQRGTMMQWGAEPCDGICRPAKCASCELQHRGLPRALAKVCGQVPPLVGRSFLSLPGKAGTALGMPYLISHNQEKQRYLLRSVDKFVLLTEWALAAASNNGAPRHKLTLNRLGLSYEDVQRKPSPEMRPTQRPVSVGYLGRYESVKGVADLARAAACLDRSVPIRVEFRGPVKSDAERNLIEEIRKIVADDPRISIAPAVKGPEVLEVLSGYDVLCCPSVCLEGGPTVAIEAHAVGTPVIGSRIGGLAELVTDGVNGRLVPPGDWRALSEALRAIASDPSGTVDRWRRALPPARTMDEVAADYLALYSSCH